MEEKTLFEILLDKDDTDNIVLSQEDGNQVEFEQIATIVLDDSYYAILHPLNLEGIDENEAVVFLLDDSAEDEQLKVVEDQKLALRVFDEYYRLLDEEPD